MKKSIIQIIVMMSVAVSVSCDKVSSQKYKEAMMSMTFHSLESDQAGDDALSSSTNQSDKDELKTPKLDPYQGTAFVKPPQINNYGAVTLSYQIDTPAGRAGMQPGVGLSYSSSGGDGLAGIGWSLSTGLGVISRTTKKGQLFYDYRDTFTFNGQRLVKVEGPANSENGTYRQEIESGFSKFVLSGAESGGVWRVYDKAGTVTTFGDTLASRIYRPDDSTKTYIWNFCKSLDLNGNYMTAEYDNSEYATNHILYLKEISYTGNERESMPARQFVRFGYRNRGEAYMSKSPGFIMKMDRLLDTITVGWDDPLGLLETTLWSYRLVYQTSADSNRPLLTTIDTERETTRPEFIYQPALHSFNWAQVENTRYNDPEGNPESTKYFEGDFNGDGISDMVFFNPVTGDWRAMEGNRDGGYTERYYANRFQGYEGPDRIQWSKGNVTGDYNGDGRSDIAFYLPQTKEFWVAEHNGKNFDFRCYGMLYIDIDIFKCEWFTGDFDGNGLSDTVLFNEPTGEWYLMANKGGHFEFIKFSEHFKNLFRSDYVPDVSLNSPSTADKSESGKDRDRISFFSGDFNGDGRTDISFYDARSGKWWVGENYRDDKIGFKLEWRVYKEFTNSEKELFAPGNDSLTGNDRFCGDFNGDGFSDFLIFHRDRGEWILGDTGDGSIRFRVFSMTPEFKDITRWIQGDFNGDGRTDIGFYSRTDGNFWVGEATPDGFRYRVYTDLSGGPDRDRVLVAPIPQDEVEVKDVKAVAAGSTASTIIEYQYDGNFHTDRGEKAFTGFFTQTAAPELLLYNRKDNRLYLKQGAGEPVFKYAVDLDAEGITLLNGERPDRFRDDKDGILYYKKTSSFGSDTHLFDLVYSASTNFTDLAIARFDSSTVKDFDIAKSVYMADRFVSGNSNKYILILDDRAETPSFMLCSESAGSLINTTIKISGDLNASYFANLRERRAELRFFSGPFTGADAQVLLVDMAGGSHTWYRGTITTGQISFTRLSGNPAFQSSGFVEQHYPANGSLVYATVNDGAVIFYKLIVGPNSVSQILYTPLAKGISFKGEFDHQGNPVVYDGAEVKRAMLTSICRLEALPATIVSLKRPDLMTNVYPFQWIQGDYNGDGKTDIGIFHMKERRWYFALTTGTVPDLISVVHNGIGGLYRMEYENSTRFDNTDEEGIPRLPMNYKVCKNLVVEDGLGGKVRTDYEYSGGYAFSAFINGEKETDYFGFGKFTVIDGVGRRTQSEYYNVPYEDYRMNRALAGAVKASRSYGSDLKEYERTEHEYTIHTIAPSGAPLTPKGPAPQSYLIEPTAVRKYAKGTLTETRTSEIELTAGRYEMTGKRESVTDHYKDGVHAEETATVYSHFNNIDATNQMLLEYKRTLDRTSYETTALYEYDGRGNVIRETSKYTGTGLPAVSDRIMEYAYDGYGNRMRSINASGSPTRVNEKSYDERLHQYVVQERSFGDSVTLITNHEVNYASAFGCMNKTTDLNGNSTYFEYDGQGRLVRERIDADSGVETLQEYVYTTSFPLSEKSVQYTGSGGEVATRVYADGMGRVIHTVMSATNDPGKRYIKTGAPIYDAAGRLIRKGQSDWAGDDEIDMFRAKRQEKHPTITEYDPAGRVSKVTLPEGYKGEAETSISYTYKEPWETIENHSVGRSKRTVKNARGQVLYIEDSGRGDPATDTGTGEFVSAKIGFAYDIAGNRVKKMDLNGTTMTTDVPSSLFAPGVKDTSGSNVACWRYNAFGQVTESSDPDLGYASVSYNSFGETSARTDALGRATIFSYDRLGRLTNKELPGTEGTVVYSYDALAGSENTLGRMTAIDDPAQRKEFSYDKIGRVKLEKRRIKGMAGAPLYDTYFQYDLLSRKTGITYPADPLTGVRIQALYSHCAMGVTRITIGNGQTSKDLVSGISYNEFGQMTEARRGNGTVTTYTYDIKGRLEALLTTSIHNGQTWKVQDMKYGFKVDNSISAVENNPDVDASGACIASVRYEYAYDGLNRLVHGRGNYEKTRATAPAVPGEPMNPYGDTTVKKFELGYAYAANGNLIAKSVYNAYNGALTDTWIYSYENHAATSIATSQAGDRFAMVYDAAGNMISESDTTKNLAKQMAYDSYNRIRQVTDQYTGTIKGQYWYDDQGFRVRREAVMDVGGEERKAQLLYPSMYFSVETQKDQNGVLIEGTGFGVNNIYLNGVRVAAVLPNCDAQYYLTDQLDSVKVVTNDSGMVVTSHEYLPFGEDWITEGDTKNAPKYNSQELDKESGYYIYNARHYDPEIGRFVTPDTIIDGEYNTQGWNRFAYVKNNPIRYKDPTGHNVCVLNASQGADGFGHSAALVKNDKTGRYEYYSKNGEVKGSGSPSQGEDRIMDFKSISDFFKRQEKSISNREDLEIRISKKEILLDKDGNPDLSKIKDSKLRQSYHDALELTYFDNKLGKASARYEKGLEIATTKEQDRTMRDYMRDKVFKEYYFFGSNCKDLISRGLNKAGISNQNTIFAPPSIWYESLKTWYVNERTGYLTEEHKTKTLGK